MKVPKEKFIPGIACNHSFSDRFFTFAPIKTWKHKTLRIALEKIISNKD